LLMRKCVSIHWESMFTRSMLQTADMAEQHALLDKVAGLVDAGKIRTTVAEHFEPSMPRTSSARMRCSKPARPVARSCWRGSDQLQPRARGALRLFDRIN
jgi:hypothetical protein